MATYVSFSTTATTSIFLGYTGNPVYGGIGSAPPSVHCWHTMGVSTCHLTCSSSRASPDSARMQCLVGGIYIFALSPDHSLDCCYHPARPSHHLPIPILESSLHKIALTPDIIVNASKFQESAIFPATTAFNSRLQDATARGPKWFEVGAPKFRQMIHAGETSIPKPIFLDSAESFSIPCRDSNRSVPCRVQKPTDGSVKGVYMHLHLGGWTLGDETSQSPTHRH
jgi:hypothetical protein